MFDAKMWLGRDVLLNGLQKNGTPEWILGSLRPQMLVDVVEETVLTQKPGSDCG
jgi:hypothetical protein